MEARDFYDLFFIAIIAIVLARAIKRRQKAEERRRARLPESQEPTRAAATIDDGPAGGSPGAASGVLDEPAEDPADGVRDDGVRDDGPAGPGGRAGAG